MKCRVSCLPYILLPITASILFCFNLYAVATLNDIDTDISSMQTQIDVMKVPLPLETKESNRTYAGTFTATGYCPCKNCCGKWSNLENPLTASGTIPEEGITVGADWGTLPKGTEIYVEGIGYRTVQDKTASWINKNYNGKILDIYFHNHKSAIAFGKKKVEVWICN